MISKVVGEASLEAMAANPAAVDRERVAREFEALLVAEVWKGAHRGSGEPKLLGGGSAERMYRDFFIDEVTRRVSLSRGLGIAERLVRGADASAGEEASNG